MARLYRDAFGIPHVRGTSMLDVAHGQGRAMALDRTWQLEWLHRRALGTTAELLGADAVPWDRLARQLDVAEVGRRAFAAAAPETRDFLAAYAEGVSEELRDDSEELLALGARPQPWEPWLPLATFHAQHVLFGSLGARIWRGEVEAALGPDGPRHLAYEPPTVGSNAWAVGGRRTASGYPLIGGDPHRVIEQPGVYAQVRLVSEDPEDRFDVAGFCFVGLPGVSHFAHAGPVAWAITNAGADQQDVHDEADLPQEAIVRRRESIAVRGEDPVEVDVVETVRGWVFEPGSSVRDAATVLGDLGADALPALLRARTVDDVDRALDAWVEPGNNVVIADRAGAVRYRVAGRIPTRDGERWTGWVDPLPRHDVGPTGQVVTANERRGAESDAVGSSFAPPYRARRIEELLGELPVELGAGLTTTDFVTIHNDTALATVPVLTGLVPGAFDDFDGRMEAGSAPAARFARWRSALALRVAAQPVFDGLRGAPTRHPQALAPFLDLTQRVALALPTLAAAEAPFGLDLPALARAALADIEADVEAESGDVETWGERHPFVPVHVFDQLSDPLPRAVVPAQAVSGDTDCVRCTSSYPGRTDVCFRGSVVRYVWDLADRSAGGWVVASGASGHAGDPHHHDQTGAWAEGRLVPIVEDWGALTPG